MWSEKQCKYVIVGSKSAPPSNGGGGGDRRPAGGGRGGGGSSVYKCACGDCTFGTTTTNKEGGRRCPCKGYERNGRPRKHSRWVLLGGSAEEEENEEEEEANEEVKEEEPPFPSSPSSKGK